ncbi:hypothetical protein [Providencia burhodogranariea]|uniref:Uncharacterized protein n=1 Tax=Providencia burhodogranariea DSM 19968 TaxID=1141662 RepID=K8WVB0_9GAMM|nr:hypothetical protein OOA_02342 [Providencia burhodogranariea DSM 19968]
MPSITKQFECKVQYDPVDKDINITVKKSESLKNSIRSVVSSPKKVLTKLFAHSSVSTSKDIELQKVNDDGKALYQLVDKHSAYMSALNNNPLSLPQSNSALARINSFSLVKKAVLGLSAFAIPYAIYKISYNKGYTDGTSTDVIFALQHPKMDLSSIDLENQANDFAYTSQLPRTSEQKETSTEESRTISLNQLLTQDEIVAIMGGDSENDSIQIKTLAHVSEEITAAKYKVNLLCQSNIMVNNQPSQYGLNKDKWQFISQTLEIAVNEVDHQREEIVIRAADDMANYLFECAERAQKKLSPVQWDNEIPLPPNQRGMTFILRDLSKCDLIWLKDNINLENLNSQLAAIIERAPKEGLLSLTTNEMTYFADIFKIIARNHKNNNYSDTDVSKELIQADKSLTALHQASDYLNESYKSIQDGMKTSTIFSLNDWRDVMKALVDIQEREARILERKADNIANYLSIYLKNEVNIALSQSGEVNFDINSKYSKSLGVLAKLDSSNGDIQRLVKAGMKNSDSSNIVMKFNANELIELSIALKNKKSSCIKNEYVNGCSQNS